MSYDLGGYAAMMADPIRGRAYLRALGAAVRPGDVVADIGAGPGVLGVFAAVRGARRVFVVDPDRSVNAAAKLAEENGVQDRVEIYRARSEDIVLPEQADVIVSDLRGVLPFHAAHFATVGDARRRHLRAGGRLVPRCDHVHAALVEAHAAQRAGADAWSALDGIVRHATLDGFMRNQWHRVRLTPGDQVSESGRLVTLDYAADLPGAVDGELALPCGRDGTATGIAVWFDAELTQEVGFSNAPHAPSALYGQAYFPLARPIELHTGERADVHLRCVRSGDDHAWSWRARLAGTAYPPWQSSLYAHPIDTRLLHRLSLTATPSRAPREEALATLLGAMDGSRSIAALAELLRQRHADILPSTAAALDFVRRQLAREGT